MTTKTFNAKCHELADAFLEEPDDIIRGFDLKSSVSV
jgi:hypothetical protein